MHIFLYLLCILSIYLQAHEERVEIVTKFGVDSVTLSSFLKNAGSDLRVQEAPLASYQELLAKNKSLLRKVLRKIHLEPQIEPALLDPYISKIVFYDLPGTTLKNWDLRKIAKERLVLFMWEPPVIMPEMYTTKVPSLFSKIYTWNDALVDNRKFFKFFYPVCKPLQENLPSFDDRKLCTLVNSKIKKNHPHELYSQRLRAIEFFEKYHRQDFEFYGRGWDAREHPQYLGAPQDKSEVMKYYRFSICYENMTGIQGYITEKIFDSLSSGCIPIYWGATNISDYIPKDCFIDRRDFTSLEDLYVFMKKMSKEDYQGYINRIRNFLNSDAAKLFSMQHFEKIFCEACL